MSLARVLASVCLCIIRSFVVRCLQVEEEYSMKPRRELLNVMSARKQCCGLQLETIWILIKTMFTSSGKLIFILLSVQFKESVNVRERKSGFG